MIRCRHKYTNTNLIFLKVVWLWFLKLSTEKRQILGRIVLLNVK